jgi:transcriptional regulator GlxA family with amidase domain
VVEDMLGERSLLRVDQVAERHDLSRRALERLFARYVGVGPKWVLARYRMHDAVSALDAGYAGSLADLAATYGWFDQAHFGRDFTALVGVPPRDYRSTAR